MRSIIMSNTRMMATLAAFIVGSVGMTAFFGINGAAASVLMGLAVVSAARYFDLIESSPIYPLTKQAAMIVGIASFVGVGLLSPSLVNESASKLDLIQGDLTDQVNEPKDSTETVSAEACSVPSELRDNTVTVSFNAYDQQADDQTSVAVPIAVYDSDTGKKLADIDNFDTSQTLDIAAGKKIDIHGGNSSYYVETKSAYCVDDPAETVNLKAHSVQSESNLKMTVFDDTGTNELTTKTDPDYTLGDYGQEASDTIDVELKNDGTDSAYWFKGFGVASFGAMDEVKPASHESAYSEADVQPDWMEDVDVHMNQSTSSSTINSDYTLYTRDSAQMLTQWDTVKTTFSFQTSTDTDPTGNAGTTNFDGVAITSADLAGAETSSGDFAYDTYAHTSSESNVGLMENVSVPAGLNTGALVMVE